jgi:hypothetical protein
VFPTGEEAENVSNFFYQESGIPGIVGIIDGTHCEIKKPRKNETKVDPAKYYNRKGFYSVISNKAIARALQPKLCIF